MPRSREVGDPKIIRMLREYRQSLIDREDKQIKRLARHWIQIENSLSSEMQLLAIELQAAQLEGKAITEQLLNRMSRYQRLDNQMKAQILKFAREQAVLDIEAEQREFGQMALGIASDVIAYQFKFGVAFDRLPADHVEVYVGLLGDGNPLYKLLKEAYPDSLDGVVKALLEGTAKGINPNQVAFNMSRAMGMGLERITLIARTEQLRVNRLVSADQYRASGLQGVMKRVATKDDRVCMACLVSDGEIIPLDKELDDHPRGRCVAVFQVQSSPTIQWQKGADWFVRQEESLQRAMMGDKKYELWKDGVFKLPDLRQTDYSSIWGNSPRVATLAELTQ
jgi:hypothetical protein